MRVTGARVGVSYWLSLLVTEYPCLLYRSWGTGLHEGQDTSQSEKDQWSLQELPLWLRLRLLGLSDWLRRCYAGTLCEFDQPGLSNSQF